MQKCSYCNKWFKNYSDMSKHFNKCIDNYIKKLSDVNVQAMR